MLLAQGPMQASGGIPEERACLAVAADVLQSRCVVGGSSEGVGTIWATQSGSLNTERVCDAEVLNRLRCFALQPQRLRQRAPRLYRRTVCRRRDGAGAGTSAAGPAEKRGPLQSLCLLSPGRSAESHEQLGQRIAGLQRQRALRTQRLLPAPQCEAVHPFGLRRHSLAIPPNDRGPSSVERPRRERRCQIEGRRKCSWSL
mmetsp:Transcript_8938/g.22888  ORF Transcript_8938/g.22888 Transcript_8938/m.22888 type:complete len:200 (+) Transcript_8938:185-784(+)